MENQLRDIKISATNGHASEASEPEQKKRKISKRFVVVFVLMLVLGGTFGVTKFIHAQHHEETDDAQIDANISPVIPRIGGYITEVKVQDNKVVKKGDTLVVLDNRDLLIKLEQAEAALAAAKSNLGMAEGNTSASQANIGTTRAGIGTAEAQIAAAQVTVRRTQQDYERYANLIKDHSITQQQFDQAEAAMQTAQRQLAVLQQQKAVATQQSAAASAQSEATAQSISVAQAMIKQREADVDNAKLLLSYSVITAPSDGHVSSVNVQPGQFVQPGQMLFSVVVNADVWVIANFKETQLNKMAVGQEVTVNVDAFPGHDFKARLSSFSPATGSKFSLLPADNASGNFVKVVQRVPVKIEFTDKKDEAVKRLRAGMNVTADVHI